MNTLFIILTVIALIASVLLTIVVLLQNSKGGGLASNFTAGNQTFGVRQTAVFFLKREHLLLQRTHALDFFCGVISEYFFQKTHVDTSKVFIISCIQSGNMLK